MKLLRATAQRAVAVQRTVLYGRRTLAVLSTAFIRTLNIAVQITMLTVPEYNINAKQREFAGHTLSLIHI